VKPGFKVCRFKFNLCRYAEADVGGWAHVPNMRLGGQDPLGGPDRGRSGIDWGTLHNIAEKGEAVSTMGATQTRQPRNSKPWEQRGMHPGRRKQPVGGSDVLTGLWMSSSQSYGMSFDNCKPDREAKTNAAKAQFQAQLDAPYRPERVLSTAGLCASCMQFTRSFKAPGFNPLGCRAQTPWM
jgi:hypothetical protein